MAKAPAKEQLKLLDIAELDKTISKLDRKNEKHPLRQELGTLINVSAARARDKEAAQERAQAAREKLEAAERASAALRGQIDDKEAKLNSGAGLTSRDLLVLQDEIAGLRGMLEEASEAEFAALDGVEKAEAAVDALSAEIERIKDEVLRGRSELEDDVASILAERERVQAERDELFAPLSPSLKDAYERSRRTGGYAVIGMQPDGGTDAGISLSPVEVAQIKALPEDEVYLSEDYDCIIVRLR
ncbi:hypothetical protein A4H34_09050 [Peptidiphaga gingivicola]|uniref:CT398-like coiled coil hairpin domain-containing protein n=1 Tax=Peptidiphaga gingivicola TaxID=2741497 RepID=A0A179B0K2_9ACTO|nr:hypothetical protein [Peptidiphaga gingivicola]OAP85247.1 hypothetical protein A4H34_09050 [Peptidiphaga gingivicola]